MKKGEIKFFDKHPFIKNILLAAAIAVLGFVLLNLAFIFDAFYQGIIRRIVGLFIYLGPETRIYWLPSLFHGSFVIVIGIISWFIFRTRLNDFWKATYMIVPLAVVFATIGIFFYQNPIMVYVLGGLFGISVLYYLYKTKKPWLYYYALILIGIAMLLVVLFGIEI